jgi:hypothetical protein
MKVCLQEVITHCQSSPGTPPCSTSTLLGRTGNGRVIYTRGQSALRWKNKTESREWSRRRRRQTNITKPDEHLFIGGREKTTFRLKRHQLHEKTKMTKRNQSTTAGSRLVFGHSDRFTLGWEATKDQRATNPTSSWVFVVGRSSSVTGNGRVLSGQSIRNRIDGDYVVFLVGEIY